MKDWHLRRWRVGVLALAFLVACVGGCRKPPGGRVKPQLTLDFDWNPEHDVGAVGPGLGVTGELLTVTSRTPPIPLLQTSGEEETHGQLFRVDAIYRGSGARNKDPQAKVLEMRLRRVRQPKHLVEGYLRCKVLCELRIDSFADGVLLDADTQQEIKTPYLFGPGEYHFHALGGTDPTKELGTRGTGE